MKKITLALIAILILTLTACSASSATAEAGPAAPSGSNTPTLSTEETLLIGTFKLEGTGQAITAEQAAELLPLWQVYQDLQTSDTAAQAEITALLDQIQETMTEEQVQAIESMNLTQQDVFAFMQEQGVGMVQRTTTSSDSTTSNGMQNSGGMAPPDGGGMPGGAPPDGGGTLMENTGGSNTSPDTSSNTTTQMNPSSLLIEALIELLQTKIAA